MGIHDLFPSGSQGNDIKGELSDEQFEVLDKVAKKVVDWRMAVPAIMALETAKPLSFIGSQAMVFFEPIVKSLFAMKYYDTFRELMEDRENVERLLQLIEKRDSELVVREKDYRKKLKIFLKRQSFGKRAWMWFSGRYPNLDQLNEQMERWGITQEQIDQMGKKRKK